MNSKYKCIRQVDETDCGAASLASVCMFYDKVVPLSKIRRLAKVDRYGTNMLGIYYAAIELGFDAEGLSGTLEEMLSLQLPLPCIAHVLKDGRLEHFVVIFEIAENFIIIGDPANGIDKYSLEKFSQEWSGHIMILVPNKSFRTEHTKEYVLAPFFKMVFTRKEKFATVAMLSFVSTILSISVSVFSYYLIDIIIPNQDIRQLVFITSGIFLINLIILFVNILHIKLVATLSKSMNQELMSYYVQHLLNVDYSYYDNHTTGDMVSRLQDVDVVRDAVSKIVVTVLLDAIMVCVSMLVFAALDIRLFAVSFCIFFIYAIVTSRFNKPINKVVNELRSHDSSMETLFLESIKGIETIKTYQIQQNILDQNKKAISKLMESFRKANVIFSGQSAISNSIVLLGETIILAVGGFEIVDKSLSFGTLFMFYTLFSICASPIKNIVELFPIVNKAKVSATRLLDTFSENLEDKKMIDSTISLYEDIYISGICYRCGNRDLVLNDFTLNITAGDRIALVGNSGSGKSTFAKILSGLYISESGHITIGRYNLNELSLGTVRAKITYVSQNTFLFRGSILDNIRIGNLALSDEAIVQQFSCTAFQQFINQFPMGYQSIVTENGNNLSGGQRQLIALMRAIIKQGDILILDEAISAVDDTAAKLAINTINILCPRTTILVIAHHGIGIEMCNRIATINKGRIESVKSL